MNLIKTISRELSEGYGLKETKKIIAKCQDMDENVWPVIVSYEITDKTVKVYDVNKLERNYFDLKSDVCNAIMEEEGSVTIEF